MSADVITYTVHCFFGLAVEALVGETGVMVRIFNLGTQEAETGKAVIFRQPGL